MAKSNSSNIEERGNKSLGIITLEPRGMGSIHVGIYERPMSKPSLKLVFKPSHYCDLIGAKLETIEHNDEYELVYRFQNFGQESCTIDIVLLEPASQSLKRKLND